VGNVRLSVVHDVSTNDHNIHGKTGPDDEHIKFDKSIITCQSNADETLFNDVDEKPVQTSISYEVKPFFDLIENV
jgi:hypothetical protein